MNLRITITAAAASAAASLALYPLLSGSAWFLAGLGAILVAAIAGMVTRLRAIPALACLLAALAAEFIYLNAVFARAASWGRIAPTAASVAHLGHLLAAAMTEAAQYAPPAPGRPGITLLAAGGIGLVAVATDLLGVRLRRPALAGLPLLVLFCVPATTGARAGEPGSVAVFCLGMTGYLALLSADGRERLRRWGRVVRSWENRSTGRDPETRLLASTGRRIGIAAVVIGLGLPLLLPGLTQHRLFATSGGKGPGSSGGSYVLEPLVQLNQALRRGDRSQVLLRYRTTDPSPPYLQEYVLDTLGTTTWTWTPPVSTAALGTGTLPAVPGLVAGTPTATSEETVTTSPVLGGAGLPVPYAPRLVRVAGQWRVSRGSLTILSAGTPLKDLTYQVTSQLVTASSEDLRGAPAPPPTVSSFLTYPKAFAPLVSLAHSITAGHTTAIGMADALQRWFTSGRFTYTLNATEPDNADALITFLTRTRRGYCQQFAFGMAVLARLLGIPSRVVVGFTPGTRVAKDTWQVTNADAHAWPELYFAGFGWLRFEPTPAAPAGQAGQPGQVAVSAPPYTVTSTGGSGTSSAGTTPTTGPTGPSPRATAPAPAVGLGRVPHGSGGTGAAPSQQSGLPWLWPVLIIVIALVLALPWLIRSVTRRRRWRRAADDRQCAHAAWRELLDDLTDHRLGYQPSESPRALARRLDATLGLAEAERGHLDLIARAAERASYAALPLTPGPRPADVTAVRRALAASCGPWTRWSARLAPLSLLARIRAGLGRVLGATRWNGRRSTPEAGGATYGASGSGDGRAGAGDNWMDRTGDTLVRGRRG